MLFNLSLISLLLVYKILFKIKKIILGWWGSKPGSYQAYDAVGETLKLCSVSSVRAVNQDEHKGRSHSFAAQELQTGLRHGQTQIHR